MENVEETETEATRRVYPYYDSMISVIATLDDASQIPDDADLVVRPVTPAANGYNYDAYMEALNGATVNECDQNNTLLYDIAFIGPEKDEDGNETGNQIEYQPEEGSVRISVTLKQSQISEGLGAEQPQIQSQDVEVFHLPLTENVKDETSTTAEATGITASDINVEGVSNQNVQLAGSTDQVTFSASSFSVFAFTVDFHYEGVDYSIPGMSQILLSDLIEKLNIKNGDTLLNVSDVASVEFSDNKLVTVEQVSGLITYNKEENVDVGEKDFLLTSKEAFSTDEKLTITLENGKVIEVGVTDAMISYDLSNFLIGADIVATKDEDGKYKIMAGESYSIVLTFQENSSMQFPDNDTEMTYNMPEGLEVVEGMGSTFSIRVNDGQNNYMVNGNTYKIENGQLKVQFNTSDSNFEKLAQASNAKFGFTFDGRFKENASKIVFKQGIVKDIVVDTSNSVDASKSATVDLQNNKVPYTLAVKSTRTSSNVVVTDTITGSALNLESESIKATSSTGKEVAFDANTKTVSGNTFTCMIPEMSNGEVVTITYDANIDPSKITKDRNNQYVQVGKNSVEVKSDGDPTPDKVDVNTSIDYTPSVQKGNAVVDEDGRTLHWTITANPECARPLGSVTDNIGQNSQSFP